MSRCYLPAILGYVIPLLLIGVAALTSGWFNMFNNALSDLGHAVRSNVAVIFNLGLALGSLFILLFAIAYSTRFNKLMSILLVLTAFFLNLIAIFDEVYGRLHFIVSVAFFISVGVLLIGYSITFKKYITSLLALAISASSWYLYFNYRVPEGAAIPELVSIIVVLPFYADYVRRVCSLCKV
ncbi:MAG: DUF998 domain-containing protein [Sulfolobales archaeon]